ncbi:MAG: UDP-N-acetylmuramoyl-tripeptide--D-alanyl-D-alanine ligase [Coriobacteriia bacterium]|nr:UDP-N-acetylmuramoyl-tripeptide--D-alanyl-D-alanine ligase [Coriobacteriia bacterium]
MLTASATRIAEICGGSVILGSGDAMAYGVTIDSRRVTPGCAFIALPGERVDAHAFVAPAIAEGARVAIVARWDEGLATGVQGMRSGDWAVVMVSDTVEALRALAGYQRSRLHCPVIGITGSTGKTTTKDFLAAVLATRFKVVATKGNRNNEIGVPLTVLDAGADTDVLLVEMGMRGSGQIAHLCSFAKPTLGIVTNVGQTHLEVLGSQEAILHAKGELVRCIPHHGAVFLNGDDAWSRKLEEETPAPVTWYGMGEDSDVRASEVETDEAGRPTVTLSAGDEKVRFTLPVPGRHNAYTAAATAAVALYLGLTLEDVAAGLAAVELSDMRMQVFTAASGVTVVNDAYNANPTSMRAALTALSDMRTGVRRIAVLGDMAELGSLEELAHFKLGEEVARASVDVLVTVGQRSARIADGARAAGMATDRVRECATADEASEVLDDLLEPGDVVMVKASRSMGLERIVEGILRPHV